MITASREDVQTILKNREFFEAWLNRDPTLQVYTKVGKDTYPTWVNANSLGSIEFDVISSLKFRFKTPHEFVRYVVTWTGADGKTQERIHKVKRFAEEFLERNSRYRANRDSKLHEIRVKLDV